MSRAALYAFGATSLGLAAACTSSTTTPGSEDDAGSDVHAVPLYGGVGVPVDAHSDQAVGDAGTDSPTAQPLYGASFDGSFPIDSPTTDEGVKGDADSGATAAYGAPADAGHGDVHVVPLYGATP
jgi:hypothetical protein